MNPAADPAVLAAVDVMTEKWPGSLTGEAARLGEARLAERQQREAAMAAGIMAGQAEQSRIAAERLAAHHQFEAANRAERETAAARAAERKAEAERQWQTQIAALQKTAQENSERYRRDHGLA